MAGISARDILLEARQSIADTGYVKRLMNRWGEFLEGIPDRTPAQRHTLGVQAILYENQLEHLKNLNEETRSTNVGSFQKYIFPVLRRVFPNLIANEIVSVQPLSASIGAIFFLDFIYGSNKGSTRAGDVFPRDFNSSYTSERVDGEILGTGDGVNYGGAGTSLGANLAYYPVRPLNTSQGYKLVIREINAATGATVQEATDNGTGGFTGNVSAGTINYSNGALTLFKFTAAPVSGNPIRAFYYYDGEMNPRTPQVSLDVKKAAVEATARRVKALWSTEAAEDLRAYQGVDAESELVSVVAQEMALEIDRDIIGEMFQNSTGTSASFDRIPPAGIAEHDHLRAMLTVISKVANTIHRKTLRAPATVS